jgi:cytochrome c oxidase assembly protein subunit 11
VNAAHAVDLGRRTRRTAWICAGVVASMLGLAYASVPLYRLFCQLTGFDGTPVRATSIPTHPGEHQLAVRFNAETSRGMPWIFRPVQREVTVKVGEPTLIAYRAHNPTSRIITGTASFNVTPEYAAKYFAKVQCFCFTEQTLAPNQTVDMPVSFYVDPAIVDDPDGVHLPAITLSYTFFAVDAAEKAKK